MLAAGDQQERLIEALLTLARGQTGLERRAPFDLATVTGQVLQACSDADHRAVEVHEVLGPAPGLGDPRLVERLVANLVDNATRYNVPHGNIHVTTQTRSGQAVVSVANTGPVVPPTAVERLFQPFQRLSADRTSRGDGVGLGLSIVQAIADAHGATITAHPQAGGGLDIEVSFPGIGNGVAGTHARPDRAHSALTGTANRSRLSRLHEATSPGRTTLDALPKDPSHIPTSAEHEETLHCG